MTMSPLSQQGSARVVELIKFFDLILPTTGHRVLQAKRGSKFLTPQFYATNDDFAPAILSSDAAGMTVYHALASYREALPNPPKSHPRHGELGRCGPNALMLKALFFEIDVHPSGIKNGKPCYHSTEESIEAVAKFCEKAGVPAPLLVASSLVSDENPQTSGLHGYHPLEQELTPKQWRRHATGLKALCERYGLLVDPARTCDVASVLRPPGTTNRKSDRTGLVQIVSWAGPYGLSQFTALQDASKDAHIFRAKSQSRQPPLALPAGGSIEHLLTPNRRRLGVEAMVPYPPSDPQIIAARCGQIQEFRDKRGNMSEPQWSAGLWLLAFCENGDKLAHEWSSGDPRYAHDKTQEQLDRAREKLSGPTTCAKFHSVNEGVCEKCPFWGTKLGSPIALGRFDVAMSASPAVSPSSDQKTITGPHDWERTQKRAVKSNSYVNARIAVKQLGLMCCFDVFHHKKWVRGGGDILERIGPELSDPLCRAVRDVIIEGFNFDPYKDNVKEALERACEETQIDPIQDYLDGLQWDGQPRVDRWLSTYLGAGDTPFARAVGRLTLTAAVRRARQPGVKFDYILVLEGPQRAGKSSALRILAGGPENFSDQGILHLKDEQAQQEQMEGVWIYEIAELVGLRRAEVERVKTFLSRTHDKARPAYGRYRIDQPRRCIFVGTTNDAEYLRDTSGNSRFWPVRTGTIDLQALQRDRDQLFAEAVYYEKQGQELILPKSLWEDARIEQEARLERDPWRETLAEIKGCQCGDEERIATATLLTLHLGLTVDRQQSVHAKRVKAVMNGLGWEGPKDLWLDGRSKSGYVRVVRRTPPRPSRTTEEITP